jgi:hypothetical protein
MSTVTQANRTQLLRGIAFVPGLVTGIEGRFLSKSGEENEGCGDVRSAECAGISNRIDGTVGA